MTKRRILYMPIETKARELLGKAFLAARAAERGWITVMGAQPDTRIYMRHFPPGVWVENSIPDRKIGRLSKMQQDGHRVVNLCEESIFYTSAEDYCARKLGAGALEYTDQVLAPGERNASHIRTHRPDCNGKVQVTGNPRFDVLQPSLRCVYNEKADAIREKYGPFILANTNFPRVNPFDRGVDLIDLWHTRGIINSGSELDFLREHAAFKRRHMEGFQALLKDIAASGLKERIILRPHPGECHDVWHEWAKGTNIEIHFEGSANDWILAAEAVLHPGCTTGAEAVMLDRPSFSFVPEPDSPFINQPDLTSQWVTSADEFVQGFNKARGLSQDQLRQSYVAQRDKLRSYIVNMDQPYSADRILDSLEDLDTTVVTVDELGLTQGFWPRVKRALDPRRNVRLKNKRLARHKAKLAQERSSRGMQKLGDIHEDEILKPLSQWVETGAIDRLPQLSRLTDQLWAVH